MLTGSLVCLAAEQIVNELLSNKLYPLLFPRFLAVTEGAVLRRIGIAAGAKVQRPRETAVRELVATLATLFPLYAEILTVVVLHCVSLDVVYHPVADCLLPEVGQMGSRVLLA